MTSTPAAPHPPDFINEGVVVMRLTGAAFLGGLIGLQREFDMNSAGIRTHMMVALGACLMMVVSRYGFTQIIGYNGDPGRIAAQVVSGIGFLGAGVILRQGLSISGLATAASIWVCSGIGLAVGTDLWFSASITTLLVITLLQMIKVFEQRLFNSRRENVVKLRRVTRDELTAVLKDLAEYGVLVRRFYALPHHAEVTGPRKDVALHINVPKGYDEASVLARIASRTPSLHQEIFSGEEGVVYNLYDTWLAGANKPLPPHDRRESTGPRVTPITRRRPSGDGLPLTNNPNGRRHHREPPFPAPRAVPPPLPGGARAPPARRQVEIPSVVDSTNHARHYSTSPSLDGAASEADALWPGAGVSIAQDY